MEQETMNKLKQQLTDRKRELIELIREQKEEVGAIQSSRSPDWVDLTAATESIHLLMTLGDSERRELDDIEIALSKLTDGLYGVCEGCGKQVGFNRLEAMPIARLCKTCKEEEEATLKPTGPGYTMGWKAIEQDPSLLAGTNPDGS